MSFKCIRRQSSMASRRVRTMAASPPLLLLLMDVCWFDDLKETGPALDGADSLDSVAKPPAGRWCESACVLLIGWMVWEGQHKLPFHVYASALGCMALRHTSTQPSATAVCMHAANTPPCNTTWSLQFSKRASVVGSSSSAAVQLWGRHT